ncbi:MAG TPA: exodeoxyribonuclease VII large subunit, partial [Nitrospirota bacterium]
MQLDLNIAGPLSVSELTRRIKDTLELRFADVWVQGEITGLRIPSSGHLYFSLKDRDAQIKSVFFRASTRFLKFQPKDGLEVIARGRISVYEPRGEYQIVLEYMEPVGLGALQLALIQLKEKLGKEGLFDEDRKKALPAYPKCVGVVTSPTGAAIRDILKVLKRRAPGVRVIISPASVQGENAPQEIAQAISNLNEQAEADVIIVGRGGGSMEDLMAFNTEVVARA